MTENQGKRPRRRFTGLPLTFSPFAFPPFAFFPARFFLRAFSSRFFFAFFPSRLPLLEMKSYVLAPIPLVSAMNADSRFTSSSLKVVSP